MDVLTFLSNAAPYLAAIISAAAGSVATIAFAGQRSRSNSALVDHRMLMNQLAQTEKQQLAAEAQQEAVRAWLAAQVEEFKKQLEFTNKKLTVCESTNKRFIANQIVLREKLSTLQLEFRALQKENARLRAIIEEKEKDLPS